MVEFAAVTMPPALYTSSENHIWSCIIILSMIHDFFCKLMQVSNGEIAAPKILPEFLILHYYLNPEVHYLFICWVW